MPKSLRFVGSGSSRAASVLAKRLTQRCLAIASPPSSTSSWRPGGAANDRPVSRFTRLARSLPEGDRVFLSIELFQKTPGGQSPSAGSYSLTIDIVSAHGADAGASFVANVNYTVVPISSLGLGGQLQ